MVFGNHRINYDLDIHIHNHQITRVSKSKFLGVLINKKLTWKDQINNVKTNLSRITGVMYKSCSRNYKLAYRALLTVLTYTVLLL